MAFEAARADGCDVAEADDRVDLLIRTWTADADRVRRHPKRDPVVIAPPASGTSWAGIVQDIKYAARVLRRQPGVALVAMLTMALGIGATTTLFSITYGVMLKPLPWPDADRLVRITETRKGHEPRVRGTMSNGPYHAWRWPQEKP